MYRFYTFSVISQCLSNVCFYIIFITKEEQEETKNKTYWRVFAGNDTCLDGNRSVCKMRIGNFTGQQSSVHRKLHLPVEFWNLYDVVSPCKYCHSVCG